MISSNIVLLFLVLITIAVLFVELLLGILLLREYAKKNRRLIRKPIAVKQMSGQPENVSPVLTEVYGPKFVDNTKNELVESRPTIAPSRHAVTRKRASTNIDEEHKYTQPRTHPPDWYVQEGIRMILPYYPNATKGVDLRVFPGACKVYVDGRLSWTSNVTDLMSAQALWQAAQKHRSISIEPEKPCQLVEIAKD